MWPHVDLALMSKVTPAFSTPYLKAQRAGRSESGHIFHPNKANLPQSVEDSVVTVFGDPVQHGEAGDEVSSVEQG